MAPAPTISWSQPRAQEPPAHRGRCLPAPWTNRSVPGRTPPCSLPTPKRDGAAAHNPTQGAVTLCACSERYSTAARIKQQLADKIILLHASSSDMTSGEQQRERGAAAALGYARWWRRLRVVAAVAMF
jgi:hypothetical protein